MNVYDGANQLAKQLKESHEFKKLFEAKEVLKTDADAKKMVDDFMQKQAQLQFEVMSGKEVDKDKQEQLQKLYEVISLNSKGRDYIQAYMRFNMMMEDIYKILSDTIKPVVSDDSNA